MFRLFAHWTLAVLLMTGHAPCAIACAATASPSDASAAADCHGPHAAETHAAMQGDRSAATRVAPTPARPDRTRGAGARAARHEAPASVCGECEAPWDRASSGQPTARAGRVPVTPAHGVWPSAFGFRLEDAKRRAPPPALRPPDRPYRASNPPLLR